MVECAFEGCSNEGKHRVKGRLPRMFGVTALPEKYREFEVLVCDLCRELMTGPVPSLSIPSGVHLKGERED